MTTNLFQIISQDKTEVIFLGTKKRFNDFKKACAKMMGFDLSVVYSNTNILLNKFDLDGWDLKMSIFFHFDGGEWSKEECKYILEKILIPLGDETKSDYGVLTKYQFIDTLEVMKDGLSWCLKNDLDAIFSF